MTISQRSEGDHRSRLIMPEYGRNVQNMVEYALTIEDKEERTRCVKAIMQTMVNLFPYLRNEESKHKMYDHLAIMSDFRLDIDSPYAEPDRNAIRYTPERLPYNTSNAVHCRYFGRLIEEMIQQACNETDPQRRQQAILFIASRIRYNYFLWNNDFVSKDHVRADILSLSHGALNCDFPDFDNLFTRPLQQRPNNNNNNNKTNNNNNNKTNNNNNNKNQNNKPQNNNPNKSQNNNTNPNKPQNNQPKPQSNNKNQTPNNQQKNQTPNNQPKKHHK